MAVRRVLFARERYRYRRIVRLEHKSVVRDCSVEPILHGRRNVHKNVLVFAAGIWNHDGTDVEHRPRRRTGSWGVVNKSAFRPTRRRSHFNDVESAGHRNRTHV